MKKLVLILITIFISLNANAKEIKILNESMINDENRKYVTTDSFGNLIDKFYIDGLKYYNGEIGTSEETKQYLVKCPYKICKEEIIENKVTMTHKDYFSALIMFKKSIDMFENTAAAEKGLKFLKNQLNWRERKYAGYLIKLFDSKIGKGYDLEMYISDMNEFTDLLIKYNNVIGLITKGDFYYHGVMKHEIDRPKAKEFYDKALTECYKLQSFDCSLFQKELKQKKF